MRKVIFGLGFLLTISNVFAATHSLSGADAATLSDLVGMNAFQVSCVGQDFQNVCFASSDKNDIFNSTKRFTDQKQTDTIWEMLRHAGYSNTISDVSGSAGASLIGGDDMTCTPASQNDSESCAFSAE
jgi:hypothetical protein